MDQPMQNEKQNMPVGIAVSDRVELVDIRIIKSTFEQTPDVNRGKKNVDIDRKVSLQIDKEKELLFVVINFDLKAMIENIQSPVITISSTFMLVYKLRDFTSLTDEAYRSFAETNAVFNAWPYWREYVQNVTIRMGLPPLTMPVFRITKQTEVKADKTSVTKKVKSIAVSKKLIRK